ncbi:MAG TPA: hypothetical protein P5279_12240 [Anaerohalosphaeraceae bacterium]|jgi:hypothetical protein|nr:hypothetical protein [Anaerohalosphaeraceae bacterium]HRT51259.1 hypothetical protein [Anaerohalosphaeraceae bacterium]HRT87774.1 hypothetical protein [Anaerohalosphaeraceae bacterium]
MRKTGLLLCALTGNGHRNELQTAGQAGGIPLLQEETRKRLMTHHQKVFANRRRFLYIPQTSVSGLVVKSEM